MAKQSSLRINFAWAFVGNAFSSFCMWLIMVVLAKLATVETVGLYGVAQAVGLPISMLFSLKLQLAQVTDAKKDFDFGHYLAVTILTSAATIVTVATVGFSFYSFDTAVVMAVLGAGYAVVAFRYLFLAVMQKAERMDRTAVSQFLTGTLSIVLFSVIFWATRNLALGMVGLIIARTITLLAYDRPVAIKLLKAEDHNEDIAPCWHMDKLWSLVKLTAPLGLVAWIGTLFTSIPRLVLDKFVGREEVGYFTAMSTVLVLGNMLMAALGQSTSPRMAKYYIGNRKSFTVLMLKFTAVAAVIGMVGIFASVLFGRQILTILFTAEYARHTIVFVQIMVAGLLLFLFAAVNNALTTARKFAVQLPLHGLAAAACIVASFLLIPKYGITGAALSLMICYATGFLGCLVSMVIALTQKAEAQKDVAIERPQIDQTEA